MALQLWCRCLPAISKGCLRFITNESGEAKAKTSAQTNPEGPSATVKPGDGLRSLQTSSIFRTLNFELYAKPVREDVIILDLTINFSL